MYPGLQGTTENDNPAKMAIHTTGWKQIGWRGVAASKESSLQQTP